MVYADDRTPTVVMISDVSSSLALSDFRRYEMKGKYIKQWSSGGGILKGSSGPS